MASVTAVGIATLDIINTVDGYPAEDTEVRAIEQRVGRGGNATNTLVVLSQLGHRCAWAGTIADEPDGKRIAEDLMRYAVDMSWVKTIPGGKVPTSYVALNRRNGSRSIIHYRNLPEFDFSAFSALPLEKSNWLHFEGRNVWETARMMRLAKERCPQLRISLEVEKPRENIAELFSYADVILFSKAFALHSGFRLAEPFLESIYAQRPQSLLFCSWGSEGAYGLSQGQTLYAPAYPPSNVIDTLGAGDTFNAGIIHGLVQGRSPADALDGACRLAGYKCGVLGFDVSGFEWEKLT